MNTQFRRRIVLGLTAATIGLAALTTVLSSSASATRQPCLRCTPVTTCSTTTTVPEETTTTSTSTTSTSTTTTMITQAPTQFIVVEGDTVTVEAQEEIVREVERRVPVAVIATPTFTG